jgi:hypothetical protein
VRHCACALAQSSTRTASSSRGRFARPLPLRVLRTFAPARARHNHTKSPRARASAVDRGSLRKAPARRAATLLDLAQHHSDSGAAATLARRCHGRVGPSRVIVATRSKPTAHSGGFTRVSARCMSVADRANRRIGERIFRFVRKAGATALPAHLAVVQPPTQERVSLKRKSSELEARVGSSAKPKRHRAVAICCGWRRLKRRDWSSIFRPSKARSR